MTPRLPRARLALLTLMALATLVAGMPRLRCGCSPVGVIASAVAAPVSLQSCCCGHGAHDDGTIAASRPATRVAGATSVPSCCSRHHGNGDPAPSRTPVLTSGLCQKVLTAADASTDGAAGTALIDHSSQAVTAVAVTPALASPAASPAVALALTAHAPCPPPDLVTVLQRLTI